MKSGDLFVLKKGHSLSPIPGTVVKLICIDGIGDLWISENLSQPVEPDGDWPKGDAACVEYEWLEPYTSQKRPENTTSPKAFRDRHNEPYGKFFPNADAWMWNYCTFLGSYVCPKTGHNYDLGLYRNHEGGFSWAIVYDDEPGSYLSGDISLCHVQPGSIYGETLRRAKEAGLL